MTKRPALSTAEECFAGHILMKKRGLSVSKAVNNTEDHSVRCYHNSHQPVYPSPNEHAYQPAGLPRQAPFAPAYFHGNPWHMNQGGFYMPNQWSFHYPFPMMQQYSCPAPIPHTECRGSACDCYACQLTQERLEQESIIDAYEQTQATLILERDDAIAELKTSQSNCKFLIAQLEHYINSMQDKHYSQLSGGVNTTPVSRPLSHSQQVFEKSNKNQHSYVEKKLNIPSKIKLDEDALLIDYEDPNLT